jgi:hypothetical protein
VNQATVSQPAIVGVRLAELLSETTLARIALAVVAVHVLDDNFLQPQPRTSATDHLASGGITAQPREYERRVIGFFDRALLPATGG